MRHEIHNTRKSSETPWFEPLQNFMTLVETMKTQGKILSRESEETDDGLSLVITIIYRDYSSFKEFMNSEEFIENSIARVNYNSTHSIETKIAIQK